MNVKHINACRVEMIAAAKSGVKLSSGVDHAIYTYNVPVDEAICASLITDLA